MRVLLLSALALSACRTKGPLDSAGLLDSSSPETGLAACEDGPAAGSVAVDPSCTYTPVGSFDFAVEWSDDAFTDWPDHVKSYAAPMVGQLDDDDGDGLVDEHDVPDVVAVFDSRKNWRGVMRMFSGDDGGEVWSVHGEAYGGATYWPYRYATPALGDVDGDGLPEIALTVFDDQHCYPALYEADGSLSWVYTGEAQPCRSHSPAFADLEGDGTVEMIFGHLVLRGSDGVLLGRGSGGRGYYADYFNSGYQSVPVDLDGDGVQEVLAGSDVHAPDGTTICSTGYDDGYPAPADLDGDGLGEFVVTGNGYVRVFEDDCTLAAEWPNRGYGYGGPAAIADFDGDGEPEIGVADKDRYTVYEVDGTVLWSLDTTDVSSGATGSSVFDFDGDGQAEVVYGDELALWVLDGATGAVLLEDHSHSSGTVHEYPIVADVDGDGRAEILETNSDAHSGIYLVGERADDWVGARALWNQHAYSITNVEDDLSIPASPQPNWPTYDSFRAGGPAGMDPRGLPDLRPRAAACQDACGEPVTVWVQVLNEGLLRAGAGTAMALYGEDSSGGRTLLGRATLGRALLPGEAAAGQAFTLDPSELLSWERVVAAVDPDGLVGECDEADDEVEVELGGVCP